VYHFKHNRTLIKAGIAACLVWLPLVFSISARGETTVQTKLGAANVERILNRYWRVSEIRSSLARHKKSDEYAQKQMEVARLEQEEANQRFWFFPRKKDSDRIRAQRAELEAVAAREALQFQKQEREAIDELTMDIKRATESVALRQGFSVVFDSNSPHILFLSATAGDGGGDITEEVIRELSLTGFSSAR
jgi:Skp family chaperone for outer membrane proteins